MLSAGSEENLMASYALGIVGQRATSINALEVLKTLNQTTDLSLSTAIALAAAGKHSTHTKVVRFLEQQLEKEKETKPRWILQALLEQYKQKSTLILSPEVLIALVKGIPEQLQYLPESCWKREISKITWQEHLELNPSTLQKLNSLPIPILFYITSTMHYENDAITPLFLQKVKSSGSALHLQPNEKPKITLHTGLGSYPYSVREGSFALKNLSEALAEEKRPWFILKNTLIGIELETKEKPSDFSLVPPKKRKKKKTKSQLAHTTTSESSNSQSSSSSSSSSSSQSSTSSLITTVGGHPAFGSSTTQGKGKGKAAGQSTHEKNIQKTSKPPFS